MKNITLSQEEEPPSVQVTQLFNFEQKAIEPSNSIIRKLWPNISADDWNDWYWQLSNRLRSAYALSALFDLRPQHTAKYKQLIEKYHYSITPYYLSLIDWTDPQDPIRRQCVPDLREIDCAGENDPLEEENDTQVSGLVHRYPDRVLMLVTNSCAVYCRHCTRKRIWHDGESVRSKEELLAMVDYIRGVPEVREVIISGGDPLTLNIETLDWLLGQLRTVSHLEVIRIGTRVPVVLPMRVTDELAAMLSRHRPLWINTQFNHPREVTPEAQEACDKILRAGIPVSNQSVLLKGVNDSVETMKELCHALQRIMVRPYYLYQCDPVNGVEHFRTSIWKGIEIVEQMRGFTGGLCVPTFVVDAPGGGGKIPLQPFYLLSASDGEVMLRNYEGMIIRYHNPIDKERPARQPKPSRIPVDTARYKRRNQKTLFSSDDTK
ncbi:MAG: KamA family radical SAM protein [Nitrospirae bacterium]|nr:KamA family radical SAM protein [Nitrospirota bacterium]